MLATCRGRVFELRGLCGGPATPRGASDGSVRYACACYTAAGRVVAAGCHAGEWAVRALDKGREDGPLPGRATDAPLAEPTELAPSPTSEEVAVAAHDLRLLLIGTRWGGFRVLDRWAGAEGISDLAWSHDGQWLAYAVATTARASCIRALHVSTGRRVDVTDGIFWDTSPSWDPHGHFLAFLSSRCLRAVEDEVLWGLHFPRAQRPYYVRLTDTADDPVAPPPRPPAWHPSDDEDSDTGSEESGGRSGGQRRGGERGGGSRRGGEWSDSGSSEDDRPPAVVIEASGLAQRMRPMPVPREGWSSWRAVGWGGAVHILPSRRGAVWRGVGSGGARVCGSRGGGGRRVDEAGAGQRLARCPAA
jgi:hypothetical protein